mmetsp:Transcript_24837/g.71707  ORF Transcript_24837/g.71707 Transcript_24837/m.71707 type:complete len:135 (+) Transcript_24837:373-777(+)
MVTGLMAIKWASVATYVRRHPGATPYTSSPTLRCVTPAPTLTPVPEQSPSNRHGIQSNRTPQAPLGQWTPPWCHHYQPLIGILRPPFSLKRNSGRISPNMVWIPGLEEGADVCVCGARRVCLEGMETSVWRGGL